ncbi:hypothetical protein ACLOJK_038181 [Asimina triloba]
MGSIVCPLLAADEFMSFLGVRPLLPETMLTPETGYGRSRFRFLASSLADCMTWIGRTTRVRWWFSTTRMLSVSAEDGAVGLHSPSPCFWPAPIGGSSLTGEDAEWQPWLSLLVERMEHRTLVLRRCTDSGVPSV